MPAGFTMIKLYFTWLPLKSRHQVFYAAVFQYGKEKKTIVDAVMNILKNLNLDKNKFIFSRKILKF